MSQSCKNQRRIVVKMGGSLLFDENLELKLDSLSELVKIFEESPHIAAIIIGGGKIARKFIQAARHFQASESTCDTFGIQASRLNAMLLISALGSRAYPSVIKTPEELIQADIPATLSRRILIAGGFIPGQSTTSVTFQIAESLNATHVVILTDVDGIYDKDPHKNPDAVKFNTIDLAKLEEVIFGNTGNKQAAAGEYRIFDAVSMQILKRSGFAVRLINGNDPKVLRSILVREEFEAPIGTAIMKN